MADIYANGCQIGKQNLPTTKNAYGIWTPNGLNAQIVGQLQGLDWPLLPDPNFSSVKFLCHFDDMVRVGIVNSTVGGGVNLNLVAANQCPSIMPTQRKFGLYALNTSLSSSTCSSVNSVGTIGVQAVTVEGWVYPASSVGNQTIMDLRTAEPSVAPLVRTETGLLTLHVNGATLCQGLVAMTNNQWSHWAWCRDTVAGKSYLYVNGTSVANAVDANNYANTPNIFFGATFAGSVQWLGYTDESRMTMAARYPGGTAFTVPVLPFPDY